MAGLTTALNDEYRDFDARLKLHPERGDILPLRDDAAVRNSITNIVNTSPGERPFNPYFGCNLKDLLFEPNDEITRNLIKECIRASIEEFEPRFEIGELEVSETQGGAAYSVLISGVIINSQRDVDINLLIKRFS